MEDLHIGDQVLTGHKKTPYDMVYAHGHYQPEAKGEFLVLHTQDGVNVEITGEHLIFVEKQLNPVRASSVKVGDNLISPDGPVAVTKISRVTKYGLYAPLTTHGTLLINGGIWASSYTVVFQDADEYLELADGTKLFSMHDGVHFFLAPFRLYCRTALAVHRDDSSACQSYNENGLPRYVAVGIDFLVWVRQQVLAVQIFVIISVFPWLGLAVALEKLLFEKMGAAIFLAFSTLLLKAMFTRRRSTELKLKAA